MKIVFGRLCFIHLAVLDMKSLKSMPKSIHFFTVDSNNTFEMDNASGRFVI
jgi:hypothetical protein